MGNCCVTTDTPGMGEDLADDKKRRDQMKKNRETMASTATDEMEDYATGSLSYSQKIKTDEKNYSS